MWKRPDHQGAREVWGLWHSAGEEIHQDCRIDCWSPSPDFLIETCPCKGFAPLPCLIFPEKKKSTILFLANTHFWSVLGKQPHVCSHRLLVFPHLLSREANPGRPRLFALWEDRAPRCERHSFTPVPDIGWCFNGGSQCPRNEKSSLSWTCWRIHTQKTRYKVMTIDFFSPSSYTWMFLCLWTCF